MKERSRSARGVSKIGSIAILRWCFLAVALLFLALHFVHLRADFPNDSPWMDWSKYTDEGWYSDAAVRHSLLGRWYLPGDFNPAVALPVWPLMEAGLFHFTGVSVVSARALAVVCFAVMLAGMYALLERFSDRRDDHKRIGVAAPLCVLFLCLNPFFFVFERMAILEPPLAMFAVLALLASALARPWRADGGAQRGRFRSAWPQVALGLLLPAMILTKTTGVVLLPAIAYMLWHRADHKVRGFAELAALPLLMTGVIWAGYLLLCVRPHYWEDYQYLFSANAYTGFQLEPLATVLSNTFADGRWMGGVLYPAFYVAILLALFARPHFFRNPLVPASLLWAGGYAVFLAYHNNLQPRYYLVLAVPVTLLVSVAVEEFLRTSARQTKRHTLLVHGAVWLVVLLITIPDALLQLSFVLHPEYSYMNAAQAIARTVREDRHHSPLILSVSGSDLSLMTGLPSIDDDFGTMDLDERVRTYRPGWYVAWNELDDDKMDALTPLYHPVRVADFPALDDPDRDQLILYRLDPAASLKPGHRHRRPTPRPLRTRLGQQPTTTQLQH